MKTKKQPKARITSISVSRLYNTGNYTNVKYDLTAEVPAGDNASDVLRELVYVLMCLRPLCSPNNTLSLRAAEKKPDSKLSEYEKNHLEEWRNEQATYNQKRALRDKAVEALDRLGGVSVRRDAKRHWQDSDDCPY